MSVIVKGMKMPSNCAHCICASEDSRYCAAANEYIPMLGKPKWCPLVEVPTPHGRLVDADVLIEDIRKNSASYFADDFAHEWVDRQPTIVEKES
jgi:hypothetical protein